MILAYASLTIATAALLVWGVLRWSRRKVAAAVQAAEERRSASAQIELDIKRAIAQVQRDGRDAEPEVHFIVMHPNWRKS